MATLAALPGYERFAVPVNGMFDLPFAMREEASSRVAVIPVPYDGTSTWQKGADRGPAAILGASAEVEHFECETRTTPARLGIVTRGPVLENRSPEAMCDAVEIAVRAELDANRLPVVIGGEHSVSIGAIRAAAARHDDLIVVQIDAHGDTRHEYEGSECNHACVMARAREVAEIVQVGIRAVDERELVTMDESRVFWGADIARDRDDAWIERAAALVRPDQPVYLTVDLDAFDPGLVPATGTPEPGGLTWHQITRFADAVVGRGRLVGFDVVELCPREGQFASEFVAARLVQRVLAAIDANTR